MHRFRSLIVCVSLLVSSALAGCGGNQSEQVEVTVTREGSVPVFQWTGSKLNHVAVMHCMEGCATLTCRDGFVHGSSESRVDWFIEANLSAAASLASPLKYGVLPDGTMDPTALGLEVGTQYGVELSLDQACDSNQNGCTAPTIMGCATFVF